MWGGVVDIYNHFEFFPQWFKYFWIGVTYLHSNASLCFSDFFICPSGTDASDSTEQKTMLQFNPRRNNRETH
jgi:hypothetical protein